jgi:hypothetical protein
MVTNNRTTVISSLRPVRQTYLVAQGKGECTFSSEGSEDALKSRITTNIGGPHLFTVACITVGLPSLTRMYQYLIHNARMYEPLLSLCRYPRIWQGLNGRCLSRAGLDRVLMQRARCLNAHGRSSCSMSTLAIGGWERADGRHLSQFFFAPSSLFLFFFFSHHNFTSMFISLLVLVVSNALPRPSSHRLFLFCVMCHVHDVLQQLRCLQAPTSVQNSFVVSFHLPFHSVRCFSSSLLHHPNCSPPVLTPSLTHVWNTIPVSTSSMLPLFHIHALPLFLCAADCASRVVSLCYQPLPHVWNCIMHHHHQFQHRELHSQS